MITTTIKLTTLIKTLFAITLMTIVPTSVYGSSCCLCGTNDVGSCVSWDYSKSNHVFMEGTKHDGSSWKCGDDHSTLGPGPCGIVQANAFSTTTGCGCSEDNRNVVSTPACSACPGTQVQDVISSTTGYNWHIFNIGALTCTEAYTFADSGFVPTSLCDAFKNQMSEFGCCSAGTTTSSTSTSTTTGTTSATTTTTTTTPETTTTTTTTPETTTTTTSVPVTPSPTPVPTPTPTPYTNSNTITVITVNP